MKTDTIKINDKTVILKELPATEGYTTAMRFRKAFAERDADEMRRCLITMLKVCELDLGDGRTSVLDNDLIINQHFNVSELLELQDVLINFNFGFLMDGDHSNSSIE